MEYPTLFTAGTRWIAPARVLSPESVTVHEAGHQWWYGLVGSNEFEHAWMDEGINQFSEARVDEVAFGTRNFLARRYFGGFIPWVFRDIAVKRQVDEGLAGYRAQAESDAQATPSFRYWPSTGGNITYFKTALWLHTLEKWLGWPTLQRAMSTYFDAWKFRHPEPAEFFQQLNVRLRCADADEHAGRHGTFPDNSGRAPVRRGDISRGRSDDLQRWFEENRALGRHRATGHLPLRHEGPSPIGAGRSQSRADARRELHQ
jgi:hypothetical protein